MKKLLLIRHAKAEKETGGKDFDRPLKYAGILDARFMADLLKEKKIIPRLIITSPALRTKTTAEIFADTFDMDQPTEAKSLYQATQVNWIKIINRLPEEHDFVAIVGHNPGVADILYYLTGETKEVHTCTTALVELETDKWGEVSGDVGKLTFYKSPKD